MKTNLNTNLERAADSLKVLYLFSFVFLLHKWFWKQQRHHDVPPLLLEWNKRSPSSSTLADMYYEWRDYFLSGWCHFCFSSWKARYETFIHLSILCSPKIQYRKFVLAQAHIRDVIMEPIGHACWGFGVQIRMRRALSSITFNLIYSQYRPFFLPLIDLYLFLGKYSLWWCSLFI